MTLTKAIETARASLNSVNTLCSNPNNDYMGAFHLIYGHAHKALAALPDKPMTEEEILTLFASNDPSCPKTGEGWGAIQKYKGDALKIIRALKAEGVLYVGDA